MATPGKRNRALAALDDFTKAPRKSAQQEELIYEALDPPALRKLLQDAIGGQEDVEKMSKHQVTKRVRSLIKDGTISLNHLRKAAGQSVAQAERSSDEEEEEEEEEEKKKVEAKPKAKGSATPPAKKAKVEEAKTLSSLSSQVNRGLFGKVGDYFKSWW